MHIILGSESPRRRELMGVLGIPFTCEPIHADERYPDNLHAGDIPLYIARNKSVAFPRTLRTDELLITSDTIVYLDGKVLGKPCDENDAIDMLAYLSGKTHQVYTAVVFRSGEKGLNHNLVDSTDVTFRSLTEKEIRHYVHTFHPTDKAGAYGIQEWIGYIGVTEIVGSFFNVMGFPIEKIYSYLTSKGIIEL